MRVVFFGTPQFAVPSLEQLLKSDQEVCAVVTQPDRPRSRSHTTLSPTPVKAAALGQGIKTFQPERPRGEDFYRLIRDLEPDLGVVVAYGHILHAELLRIPRLGMLNVHASLLPRWRGAAPIQWSIIAGDEQTGVSTMQMEAGLDTGPIWDRHTEEIDVDATTGSLFENLAVAGATTLARTLGRLDGPESAEPQDESLVTMAPKIDRNRARIDWNKSEWENSCHIRGMDPAPGAWTTYDGAPIKLFGPVLHPNVSAPSGTIMNNESLIVACAAGGLEIGEVQAAGKKRMSAAEWLHGNQDSEGSKFE